jgi:hypothetical protein
MPRERCPNVFVLLRRIATAASTIVVAIVLAVFVPVAQLQTVAEAPPCCCPNPKKCTCPDHHAGDSGQPSMRACKQTPDAVVQAQLSVFVAPAIPVAIAPVILVSEAHVALADPHPAPEPRRPDAPS